MSLQQRPVPQTLCGVLQKEPGCKCLVLSVLIYGCLAAVTWCRCANVTKVRHFLCITEIQSEHCIRKFNNSIHLTVRKLRKEGTLSGNCSQVIINFSRYPIKSLRHVSPCDDSYMYILVSIQENQFETSIFITEKSNFSNQFVIKINLINPGKFEIET